VKTIKKLAFFGTFDPFWKDWNGIFTDYCFWGAKKIRENRVKICEIRTSIIFVMSRGSIFKNYLSKSLKNSQLGYKSSPSIHLLLLRLP
jgi:hypothetical protein